MKQQNNEVVCHMNRPSWRGPPLLLLKAGFEFQLHEYTPEWTMKNGKGSYEDVNHHGHCHCHYHCYHYH